MITEKIGDFNWVESFDEIAIVINEKRLQTVVLPILFMSIELLGIFWPLLNIEKATKFYSNKSTQVFFRSDQAKRSRKGFISL